MITGWWPLIALCNSLAAIMLSEQKHRRYPFRWIFLFFSSGLQESLLSPLNGMWMIKTITTTADGLRTAFWRITSRPGFQLLATDIKKKKKKKRKRKRRNRIRKRIIESVIPTFNPWNNAIENSLRKVRFPFLCFDLKLSTYVLAVIRKLLI